MKHAEDRPCQSIELHIEELVLHGFEGLDAQAIGEEARLEIHRLLTAQPVPGHWNQSAVLPRLEAVALRASSLTPPQLGLQVGRAVYQSLGGQVPSPERGGT